MRTFVVRIHSEGAEDDGLRGVVDDVATGARAVFHAGEELLAVLANCVRPQAPVEAPGEPSRSVPGSP
jgi:hypothetical protein